MPETKVPALPDPNTIQDPHLRRILASVKEALDIRLGRRGDPMDRAVTVRELYEGGIVNVNGMPTIQLGGNKGGLGSLAPPSFEPSIPPAPTNLTADGAFTNIILSWNNPRVNNLSHIEVWRSGADNLGNAVMIGTANGEVYSDNVGTSGRYFYWVRAVNFAGIAGPFNGTRGTRADTAIDVEATISALAGQISESSLSQSLRTSLEQTGVKVSKLEDQYTVKINAAGHVAGYGFAVTPSDNPSSLFGVTSDRFFIAPPAIHSTTAPTTTYPGMVWVNGTTVRYRNSANTAWLSAPQHYPFIVQTTPQGYMDDGEFIVTSPAGVYINDAYIRNASIVSVKIADAAIDNTKIADGAITNAKIANASIDTAKIANVLESDNFSNTRGWAIYRNGTAIFNDGIFRGTVTGSTINGSIINGGTINGATIIGTQFLRPTDAREPFYTLNTSTSFSRSSAIRDSGLYSNGSSGAGCNYDGTVMVPLLSFNGNPSGTDNVERFLRRNVPITVSVSHSMSPRSSDVSTRTHGWVYAVNCVSESMNVPTDWTFSSATGTVLSTIVHKSNNTTSVTQNGVTLTITGNGASVNGTFNFDYNGSYRLGVRFRAICDRIDSRSNIGSGSISVHVRNHDL